MTVRPVQGRHGTRIGAVMLLVLVLGACSGENDSVGADDVEATFDRVEAGLDDAAAAASARLEEALDETEGVLE